MNLYLIGHAFDYETEKVVKLFLPETPITRLHEAPADDGDRIETRRIPETGGCVFVCCAQLDGKTARRTRRLDGEPDDKACELTIGALLYGVLAELTGYEPPWGILTGVRPTKLMRSLVETLGQEGAVRRFRDVDLVTPEKTRLALSVAQRQQPVVLSNGKMSCSVYVSIPFCPTRCSYCSFVSHSIEQAGKLIPDYVELLCGEIASTGAIIRALGLVCESVYIGGGTPTTLTAPQLTRIARALRGALDFGQVREFTVEAGRPDTLDREKLEALRDAGVSRISINPQTFSDAVLTRIGRRHSVADTIEMYELARSLGFDNINMDLIAGLPGDSREGHLDSVRRAIGLAPENITVHTLTRKRASRIVTSREDYERAADMARTLDDGANLLDKAGYGPYYLYRQTGSLGNLENVGYAKPGFDCLYNIYMMEELHTVLACGAGAVTRLKHWNENLIERVYNFKYPYEYISRYPIVEQKKAQIAAFYEKYF